MSDLGELVLRITMDHGDTKSQLGQLRAEMKNLDAGFKASAAAAGGFSSGLEKAKGTAQLQAAQLEVLTRTTALLKQEYEKAGEKLKQYNTMHAESGQKLAEAKEKNQSLREEIERVKAAMEQSAAATGDNTEEYISLSVQLDELNAALKESDDALKKAEQSFNNTDKAIARQEKSVQRASTAYNQARVAQADMQTALDKTNASLKHHAAAWEDASKALEAYGKKTSETGAAQEELGEKLTKGITGVAIAAATASTTAAVKWESDFAGVKKTVDGTAEQMAGIEDGLLKMSTVIPTTAGGLSEIAANAGQLAIAADNVLSFTRTVADLSETTNMTRESAAQNFAQFANITQMPQTQFDRLGSVVVELGNNSATTESAIVDMAMNIASAGKQAGMTQAQIMGIAASLSSLGLEAAGGGTAISKAIINMQVAVETGSEDLKEFAKVAGMTTDQFAQAFKADAAGALSAFIAGLSSGNDSAIKMLTDMGITETRMRDALLRASGAGDLFTNSIDRATSAWKENTALAAEAQVRYQTTASRMTMLGNQAQIAAMQFGNDLMPVLESGMDVAQGVLDKFSSLDEATRRQIISWAGYAAAVGPAILMLGKANSAIGSISTGLSKFTGNVASAGGGLKGLLSATGGLLGPAGVAALAVAAAVGAYKWIEYASGAKAAREALEGMIATSKQWQSTQAQTVFDTGNDQLGRFGLSESDFGGADADARSWFDRLKATWTDGKKETNDIVKGYVDEFKGSSDQLREAIEQRKEVLAGLGVEDTASDKHLKQLDAYDKEVAALLKKRQNGTLTDDDQARLNEVIQARVQIQLEYVTGDGGGYDQILQGVDAEKARIEAEGGKVGVDLYADAMAAAAMGNAAYNQSLNDTYEQQHKVIAAMKAAAEQEEDEQKRKEKLGQVEEATAALNEQHQQAKTEAARKYAETLAQLVNPAMESDELGGAEEKMQSLIALLSEWQIANQNGGDTSGVLTAMQALTDGMDEGELASYLAILTQIQDAISQGGLTGEETASLFPTLDPATVLGGYQSLADFLRANAGDFEGLAGMFTEALPDEVRRVMMELNLDSAEQQWADFMDGKDAFSTTVTIDGVSGEGQTFEATDLNIEPITGKLTAITGEGQTITAYNFTINPVTGTITAITGDGKTITATGYQLNGITGTLEKVEGANQSITVTDANVSVNASVRLSPVSIAAVTAFRAANKIEMDASVRQVGLVPNAAQTFKTAFEAGLLALYDASGAPIPVTPQAVEKIKSTDLVMDADENGVLHILVVPEIGSPEAMEIAQEQYEAKPVSDLPGFLTEGSPEEKVKTINKIAESIEDLKAKGEDLEAFNAIIAPGGGILDKLNELNPEDLQRIAGELMNLMASLNGGELDEGEVEAKKAQIDEILAMVENADKYQGVGNDVSAGVAQGMTAYGWQGDAGTMGSNLVDAIRSALETHSPSALTQPVGTDVAAGVGQGMSAYSFAADAAAMAGDLKGAITGAMPNLSNEGAKIGKDFSSGVAAGIRAGKSSVINAAVEMASAAVSAAKNELQEKSPSRVGRDIGGNSTKGVALGVLDEVKTLDAATRKALLPMTSDVLDDLRGELDLRVPNVVGALRALEAPMMAPHAPGYGVAESGYAQAPGDAGGIAIDYERLADAVAARPVSLSVGKRQLASTTAVENSLAVTARQRRVAFGYGGKR